MLLAHLISDACSRQSHLCGERRVRAARYGVYRQALGDHDRGRADRRLGVRIKDHTQSAAGGPVRVNNCLDDHWLARQLYPRKQSPLLRDGAAVEAKSCRNPLPRFRRKHSLIEKKAWPDREETWFDEKDVELTFRKFQKLLTDWLKKRGYLKLQ
jgi:hypothetical protein